MKRVGAALAALALVIAGLALGSLLGSGGETSSQASRARTRARERIPASLRIPASPRIRAGLSVPPGVSVVANVDAREALVFKTPSSRRPWRRYANPTREGTPLVFLVRGRSGGRLRVLLPGRPNHSQGWLAASGVSLRANPYAVTVDLTGRRLLVRRDGRAVLRAAVGVGRAATPTPTGLYYITELLRQPDPTGIYGPWAFALSAFSPVLTHFGTGAGQVGLHGTNDPAGIGHTVSHGCIRVRNAVIARLARMLPLGTPIRLVVAPRLPHQKFTKT